MARTRASAWLVCFCLLHLVAAPSVQHHPKAPKLPSSFKFNMQCKAQFHKVVTFCTMAYTTGDGVLGNRLYVSGHTESANWTRVYDVDNNVLCETDDETGQCKFIKKITEWENHDPCIPGVTIESYGRPAFDPHSLIFFDGSDKRLTKKISENIEEWDNVVNVILPDKTELCKNTVTWSRLSDISDYCRHSPPRRNRCPFLPSMAVVVCRDQKIVYSFSDAALDFDHSLLEAPSSCKNAEEEMHSGLAGDTKERDRDHSKKIEDGQAKTEDDPTDLPTFVKALVGIGATVGVLVIGVWWWWTRRRDTISNLAG